MKKKIDILGRKVPVLAVMMVLLVIGTASAALITNYATLKGDVTVTETIYVTGNASQIANEGTGTIEFNNDGEATFTITNKGAATSVNVDTTLFLDTGTGAEMVSDTAGITITYNPGGTPSDASGNYELVSVTIAPGTASNPVDTPVTVTFGADPALKTGVYTIQVVVK